MPSTKIGKTSAPQNMPGHPEQRRDENGDWQHTERYWIDAANVDGTIPADGASTNQFGNTVTDPDGNTLYCQGVQKNAGSAPDIKEVTLTFKTPSGGTYIYSAEQNPRRVSVNGQEIPIDDERLLDTNGGPFTQTQVDNAKAAGYTSLPFYQVRYEYTKLDANFDWTEAAITNAIQDTDNPPGLSSTTSSNWWKIGFEIEETSEGTQIRENWVFNAAGLYPIST